MEKQTKDLLRVSSHQVRWRLFERNNSLLFHGEGHAQKIVRKMGQSRFSYDIFQPDLCWVGARLEKESSFPWDAALGESVAGEVCTCLAQKSRKESRFVGVRLN